MKAKQLYSWAAEGPVRSPFALPEGRLGRWAGRFMAATNRQRDVAALLGHRPGDRVLEVGYGPGKLVAILAQKMTTGAVYGVDPSSEMRRLAAVRNRRRARTGHVDLRLGTADATGFPDEYFDRVISVNNVLIWPDLEDGLRELHRITKPGGHVVIAWHGGVRLPRLVRSLRLSEPMFARIHAVMTTLFGAAERHELRTLTALRATR